MRIVLPLPPNMANSSMHWRTKNRKRQDYVQHCHATAKYDPPKIYPGVPRTLEKATITATIYHTHTMDDDNAMARLKWPVDWLVTNLWLTDDDPAHLVWTGVPTQVKCKREDRRVEFVLEPA